MTGLARLLLIAFGAALAAPALAAEPAPGGHAGLSDAQIDQRIRFLEQRLDDSRTQGQIWYWSWLAINGGSTVGNSVLAGMSGKHDDRVNDGTEAVLGAIGVADLFLRPLEARYGADPVRALPDATRAQKLARLQAAENLLRDNALRAEQRHQVLPYVGNAGLALAAGLLVGLWGERGDGITTGVANLLGGTLYIVTPPGRPEQDWNDYLAQYGAGAGHRTTGIDLAVVPAIFVDGGKVDLRLRW